MNLRFYDYLVLNTLRMAEENDLPVTQKALIVPRGRRGYINDYLDAQEIPPWFQAKTGSVYSLIESIRKWRELGVIQEGSYAITPVGWDMLGNISREWRQWPSRADVQKIDVEPYYLFTDIEPLVKLPNIEEQ